MNETHFYLFCVAPLVIINIWSFKYQKEFAKLYKKKVNPNQPFSPKEIRSKYKNSPLQFYFAYPKIVYSALEIMWKDYHDKKLNHAAHALRLSFFIQMVVIILNLIFIIRAIKTAT